MIISSIDFTIFGTIFIYFLLYGLLKILIRQKILVKNCGPFADLHSRPNRCKPSLYSRVEVSPNFAMPITSINPTT